MASPGHVLQPWHMDRPPWLGTVSTGLSSDQALPGCPLPDLALEAQAPPGTSWTLGLISFSSYLPEFGCFGGSLTHYHPDNQLWLE